MAMSKRARKRFLILAIFVVVVGAAGAALVTARNIRRAAMHERFYAQGMANYEAGDYLGTVDQLGRFLRRADDDDERLADALYKFAVARLDVPEEDNAHIASAAARARRAAQLEPDAIPPRELLLEVFPMMGFVTESLAVTEEILQLDPTHQLAMEARVDLLEWLGRRDEALEAVEAVIEAYPQEYRAREKKVELMAGLGADIDEIIEYTATTMVDLPESADAALLHARMLYVSGDALGAAEMLERARTLKITTSETLVSLIQSLRELGMPAEANQTLEAAIEDEELRPLALIVTTEDAWKIGFYERARESVAELVENLDTATDNAIGWAAILEIERGETANADGLPLVQELAKRAQTSRTARFWHTLALGRARMFAGDLTGALELFGALRSIAGSGPYEIPAYWSADIYLTMRERGRALDLLLEALGPDGDPAWEFARVGLVQRYIELGEIELAIEESSRYLLRPRTAAGALAIATALVTALEAQMEIPGDVDDLLATLERASEIVPDSGEFAALQCRALLAIGRTDEAEAVAADILENNLSVPGKDLVALVNAMERASLPSAEQMRSRLADLAGQDVDVQMRLALRAAEAGRNDEGAAMLREAVNAAASPDDKRMAERNLALYLVFTGAPNAIEGLRELSEKYATFASIQQDLLEQEEAWNDEQMVTDAIARLRAATLDRGGAWRIFEARRLLTFERNDRESATTAILTLQPLTQGQFPDVRALILSAEAIRLLGDRPRAIEYYSRALDIAPRRRGLAPTLIQLLQEDGRTSEAERRLRDYLAYTDIPTEERRQRTELLIRQGMWGAALPELAAIAEEGDPADRVRYAVALSREGDVAQAEAVFDQVLADDRRDATAVVAAADFFAVQQQMDRALAALDQLPDSMDEIDRQLVLAGFYERQRMTDESDAILAALTESSPDPRVWAERARRMQESGDYDGAADVLADGVERWPDDAMLNSLLNVNRALASDEISIEERQAILLSDVAPGYEDAVLALIDALDALQEAGDAEHEILDQIRDITRRWPAYYAGWRLLASALLSPEAQAHPDAAEHRAEAGEVVMDAISAIPMSADPAQLAYEVSMQLGRTEEASTAASIWRQRIYGDPYVADLAFASTEIALGRYESALSAMERWRERMTGGDNPDAAIIERYATALAGAGRVEEARDMLWDRVASGGPWPAVYMRVGLAIGEPHSAANEWFDRIAGVMRTPPERITIAQFWLAASELGDEAYRLQKAAEILESLYAEGEFTIACATLLGQANENLGEYDVAEDWYRKAIDGSPDDTAEATLVSLNNLAYLLVRTDGVPSEAVEFARRAVSVVRKDEAANRVTLAGYLDTLGKALLANDEHTEAIEVLRESADLNPDAITTRIALAEAHFESGGIVEAQDLVNEIRTSLLAMPDATLEDRTDELQRRIDAQTEGE